MLEIWESANLNSSQSRLPSLGKGKGHILISSLGLAQGLCREALPLGFPLSLIYETSRIYPQHPWTILLS